jgi:3-hydroxybutyryl-CoA dehydrogenase
VPLFIQCSDLTLSEAATWVQSKQRLVGFDGLFLASGQVATLVSEASAARDEIEKIMGHFGKSAVWIHETPALVLPRLVCQLANEAAFAELEGVAQGATIDLAMKLGLNYPKGPLEWGAELGYDKVETVLDHLFNEYHEERYRACVLLRQWAREARL